MNFENEVFWLLDVILCIEGRYNQYLHIFNLLALSQNIYNIFI